MNSKPSDPSEGQPRDEEESPFERFASTTKRLFAVSKKELKDKAKEAETSKQRRDQH